MTSQQPLAASVCLLLCFLGSSFLGQPANELLKPVGVLDAVLSRAPVKGFISLDLGKKTLLSLADALRWAA